MITVFLGICPVVLFMTVRLENIVTREFGKNILIFFRFGVKDENSDEFTVPKAYVFTVSALTLRGWSIAPSTWTARLTFIRF